MHPEDKVWISRAGWRTLAKVGWATWYWCAIMSAYFFQDIIPFQDKTQAVVFVLIYFSLLSRVRKSVYRTVRDEFYIVEKPMSVVDHTENGMRILDKLKRW